MMHANKKTTLFINSQNMIYKYKINIISAWIIQKLTNVDKVSIIY